MVRWSPRENRTWSDVPQRHTERERARRDSHAVHGGAAVDTVTKRWPDSHSTVTADHRDHASRFWPCLAPDLHSSPTPTASLHTRRSGQIVLLMTSRPFFSLRVRCACYSSAMRKHAPSVILTHRHDKAPNNCKSSRSTPLSDICCSVQCLNMYFYINSTTTDQLVLHNWNINLKWSVLKHDRARWCATEDRSEQRSVREKNLEQD